MTERVLRLPENIHLDSAKQVPLMGRALKIAGRTLATKTAGVRADIDMRGGELLFGRQHYVDFESVGDKTRTAQFESLHIGMAWMQGITECSTATLYAPSGRAKVQRETAARMCYAKDGLVWRRAMRTKSDSPVQIEDFPCTPDAIEAVYQALRRVAWRARESPLASLPWQLKGAGIHDTMLIEPDRFMPVAGQVIWVIGKLLSRLPTKDDKYVGARIALDIASPGLVRESPCDSGLHTIELDVVNRNARKSMHLNIGFGHTKAKDESGIALNGELWTKSYNQDDKGFLTDPSLVSRERLKQYGNMMRIVHERWDPSKSTAWQRGKPTAVPNTMLAIMAQRVARFATTL